MTATLDRKLGVGARDGPGQLASMSSVFVASDAPRAT
jgi:hypothetical protein